MVLSRRTLLRRAAGMPSNLRTVVAAPTVTTTSSSSNLLQRWRSEQPNMATTSMLGGQVGISKTASSMTAAGTGGAPSVVHQQRRFQGDESKKFHCGVCKKQFRLEVAANIHIKQMHGGNGTVEAGAGPGMSEAAKPASASAAPASFGSSSRGGSAPPDRSVRDSPSSDTMSFLRPRRKRRVPTPMFPTEVDLPQGAMTAMLELWDSVGSKRIPDFLTSDMITKVTAGGDPVPEEQAKPRPTPTTDNPFQKLATKDDGAAPTPASASAAAAASPFAAAAASPFAAAAAAASPFAPPTPVAAATPTASAASSSIFIDVDPTSPFALATDIGSSSPFAPPATKSPFLTKVRESDDNDMGKRLTMKPQSQQPPQAQPAQTPSPFAAAGATPFGAPGQAASPFMGATPFAGAAAASPFAAAAGGAAASPFAAAAAAPSPFAAAGGAQAASPFAAAADQAQASPFGAAAASPFGGFAVPGTDPMGGGMTPFAMPMQDPTAANMPGALMGNQSSDAPGEDKRFTCAHCGKAFKSELGLANHCETKHNVKYERTEGRGADKLKQAIPDLPAYVPTPVDMSATAPFGSDRQKGEVSEWSDVELFPHAHAHSNITLVGEAKNFERADAATKFTMVVPDEDGTKEEVPVMCFGTVCTLLKGTRGGATVLVNGLLKLNPQHDSITNKYYYSPVVHVNSFSGSVIEIE